MFLEAQRERKCDNAASSPALGRDVNRSFFSGLRIDLESLFDHNSPLRCRFFRRVVKLMRFHYHDKCAVCAHDANLSR